MKNVSGNIFNFAVYLPLKRLKFNFSCAKMYLTVKLSRESDKMRTCIFRALRRAFAYCERRERLCASKR